MILIVEGIDRVGKSTFIEKLIKQLDFVQFKPIQKHKRDKKYTMKLETGKCYASLEGLRLLNNFGINVVVDRFHISEFVYGLADRRYTNYDMFNIDKLLGEMGTKIVLFKPENLEQSSIEHGKDLTFHSALFKQFCSSSKCKVMECKYGMIDSMIGRLEGEYYSNRNI